MKNGVFGALFKGGVFKAACKNFPLKANGISLPDEGNLDSKKCIP